MCHKLPDGPRQIVRYDDGTGDELEVPLATTAFISGAQAFALLPPALQAFALVTEARYHRESLESLYLPETCYLAWLHFPSALYSYHLLCYLSVCSPALCSSSALPLPCSPPLHLDEGVQGHLHRPGHRI